MRWKIVVVISVLLALSAACSRDDTIPAAQLRDAIAPAQDRGVTGSDDGWPALHGPHRNSTSRETGLLRKWPAEGPPVVWRRPVGRGYAAPVLLDNRLVVAHRVDDEERLECFDPSTGAVRWQRGFPTAFATPYEYSDGPYATPALSDDAAFALSAEGTLRKVALETGEPQWERSLAADYKADPNPYAVGTSPLLEGRLVVVNVGGTQGSSSIVAVDAGTGETVWTAGIGGDSYATPRAATIRSERFLFTLTDTALVVLDPADGRIRWETRFGLRGGPERVTAVSPLIVDDLVMVTAGPGAGALVLRVLPDDAFEVVWRDRRAIDSQFNNLTTDGTHVFGFTSMWNGQAELRCLEMATGTIRWGWGSVLKRGSSLAVDGRLILLGENGHLALVDAAPSGPRVRFLSQKPILDGPTYSAPALHRGRLYLRNEQELLCLDLRRPSAAASHHDGRTAN